MIEWPEFSRRGGKKKTTNSRDRGGKMEQRAKRGKAGKLGFGNRFFEKAKSQCLTKTG